MLFRSREATQTQDSPLRGYCSPSGEGHYLTTTSLRHWTPTTEKIIRDQIRDLNEMTKDYVFQIVSFDDFDVDEDNDRTWDATFAFYVFKKH